MPYPIKVNSGFLSMYILYRTEKAGHSSRKVMPQLGKGFHAPNVLTQMFILFVGDIQNNNTSQYKAMFRG